jgi:hypothetical protein
MPITQIECILSRIVSDLVFKTLGRSGCSGSTGIATRRQSHLFAQPHDRDGQRPFAFRRPNTAQGANVAAASWFRYAYLAYASRPKSLRQLYRLVKRHRVRRIVQVGVRDVRVASSLIEVAQRFAGDQKVTFSGLDWFDARPSEMPRLTLKDAHRLLHATGASVRLIPGTPAASLASVANAHQNTDLILISSDVAADDLLAAWFYVPRMLHPQSVVLRERMLSPADASFEWLSLSQIAEWAGRGGGRRAA